MSRKVDALFHIIVCIIVVVIVVVEYGMTLVPEGIVVGIICGVPIGLWLTWLIHWNDYKDND